ncbi:MAG TPA: AfsR/SARP family transcriptional regulator, partial [Candidatus Dormibacteraeota bacterium]|nr:AfsR/SARP family transcriptional regulator [Candidatus Dormibacteraeota bacterium]
MRRILGVDARQDRADDDRQRNQSGERAGRERDRAIEASHPLKPVQHAQHERRPQPERQDPRDPLAVDARACRIATEPRDETGFIVVAEGHKCAAAVLLSARLFAGNEVSGAVIRRANGHTPTATAATTISPTARPGRGQACPVPRATIGGSPRLGSRQCGGKRLALQRAKPVDSRIDVRLLGHLEVEVSGERVRFEGVKQRRLFAVLALRAPDAVSADALVEALWGEQPPAGAVQALQKQISRLRQRLGTSGSMVRHQPPGYALDIDPLAIDSRRFEDLLRRARVALARDDPERAAADLQTALALWRGEPLADYRFDEFAQHEIARLQELGLEAIEERLAADLASGGAEDLVGELQALVAQHPLRERLRGQLMVALYRAGRQAEALETMRTGRQLLVDELGIEPGPELRRLERMILAHDSALAADRSGAGLVGRLPAPANETIGREREVAEIGELLVRADVRLVTLLGAGGVGKTRLALEAARATSARFQAGAVYVSLDGAENAEVLVAEAASALGVVAATASELGARLAVLTRGAPTLLVLDGFDRYVEDAGELGQLLAA